MKKFNRCLKCGKNFKEGNLRYKVKILVSSDFDGVLNESEEEIDLHELMQEIENRESEELEDEVHKEINFLLCKPCRDVFVRDITDLEIKQITEDEDLKWQ
ncbi:MAG: hypothetical protein A2149_09350 [Candidatus Schekmanbacteria bacterium RBG_16_38_11]|uniref:Uncharacterized protein n=2 Tax=Candidatus Schekmaniibacteriota TaxID=1817811 RepID=A0A1F7RC61_9BACT|nr:MAG: hypothetical protein A2042_04550 [Candidatus Schekmanbacteria bacterium GWA2_38_11]OGL46309.1 MAG: hypothetical protein A2149_09350 [Candidatus Schekmanbacteria bacterium RBG_16_38_11]